MAVRVRVLLMNTFGFPQLPCTHSLTPPSNSFCYCVSKYVYGVFLFFLEDTCRCVGVCKSSVNDAHSSGCNSSLTTTNNNCIIFIVKQKSKRNAVAERRTHNTVYSKECCCVCVGVLFVIRLMRRM